MPLIVVLPKVLALAGKHLKVFRSVVALITVLVMNDFTMA